ncbi:MAG: 1-deoxy-D-xylulose-5-phosphate synthase, partial [Pseudogulbenkiania sp.]|nr:1-deoxy-D-xylulose-5-phosphate synthase [Pseudogulbenkiania sp.]
LQRAYDQLIHDIALQNLPVMFAIDRAGLVGADGATHHGAFDLSYLACIPNLVVMAPSDENECRQMLYTAFTLDTPSAVRYPRGTGPGAHMQAELRALPVGRGHVRRQGHGTVAILAFGSMVTPALQAAEALDATVADMRFVKPLDVELIRTLAESHQLIVTVEENVVMGGAGSACLEAMQGMGIITPALLLGLPDDYVEHGDPSLLLAGCGLDAQGIAARITARLAPQ